VKAQLPVRNDIFDIRFDQYCLDSAGEKPPLKRSQQIAGTKQGVHDFAVRPTAIGRHLVLVRQRLDLVPYSVGLQAARHRRPPAN
jgi:hypothetical protein